MKSKGHQTSVHRAVYPTVPQSHIHLHIVYGCFHTTEAELSCCDRDNNASKPNIFTVWPVTKNGLKNHGIEYSVCASKSVYLFL